MSDTSTPVAEDHGIWPVLLFVSICMTIVAYNNTAVMTALPAIKSDLDLRPTTLQWVMNAYLLTSAVLVAVLGRLADIFGKMSVFMTGICLFALGSTCIALAGDAPPVLIGRACQGIGGAAITSTSLALLTITTPVPRRPFVLGLWGAMVAFGLSLGPVLGGFFAAFIDWRGIFVFDVLLLSIALLLSIRIRKRGIVPLDRHPGVSIDYLGAALLVVFLGPLAYGLTHGQESGWDSPQSLLIFAASAAGALAFFLVERRTTDPLIDLGLFRKPRYWASAIGMFIAGFTLFGFLYFYNLFVQSPDALDMTAIDSGLSLLAFSATMFALSVTLPRALARRDFRWPIAVGMASLAIAFWLLHFTSNQTIYADIWWKLLVIGVGFGMTFPLLPRVGLQVLPDEHAGQGSGVINTCLFFGATMGVVFGSLVSAQTVRDAVSSVIASLPIGSEAREALVQDLVYGSSTQVEQAIMQIHSTAATKTRVALRDVMDDSFSNVMILSMIVSLIGMVLASWLMRRSISRSSS